jgi:Prenyltransferase and squalene oxidase repeat
MRNSAAVRRKTGRRLLWRSIAVVFALAGVRLDSGPGGLYAAPREPVRALRPQSGRVEPLPLEKEDRKQLDETVDKALAYLAYHQNSDGSFQTEPIARPAVTSLCVMAFLSRGYRPGEGKYAANIEAAIDYVLQFQDPESGAITPLIQGGRRGLWNRAAAYTHGICGTMLADVFPFTGRLQYSRDAGETEAAQADARRHQQIEKAVRKALTFTRSQQVLPKQNSSEQGGWRYIEVSMRNDSDLSVTAWMIMFLHSSKKSGFRVPDSWIKGGLKFVHRTFSKKQHGFVYVLSETDRHCTRATVGGGILCLLLGGEQISPQIKEAVDWIFKHPFEPYNRSWEPGDRYHYSAFYCSQAMGLLGGPVFKDFYPGLLRVLSEHQHADGSWDAEQFHEEKSYGEIYSTALAVLALSPPYQKLETYKR